MTPLVVGGDSRIGRHLLARLFTEADDPIATSRRPDGREKTVLLDLADPDFGAIPPGITDAWICAGLGERACAEDPAAARAINYRGTLRTIRRLGEQGAKVVFLSSSAARRAPESIYGTLKLQVEEEINRMAATMHVTAVRFGPLKPRTNGAEAYADGNYQPITIEMLIPILIGATAIGPGIIHVW